MKAKANTIPLINLDAISKLIAFLKSYTSSRERTGKAYLIKVSKPTQSEKISRSRGKELPSNSFGPFSNPKEPNLIEANWVESCCAKIKEKELGALNNKVPWGEISVAKNQKFRAKGNSLGLGRELSMPLHHPITPVF